MADKAPANLQELIQNMSGSTDGKPIGWSFSEPSAGIDLGPKAGKRFFSEGNYNLSNDQDIAKSMEIAGQMILDYAQKTGFNLTDLAEFKGTDFDGNKQLSAKEVGAVMLAASLSPRGGQFTNQFGSMFDNNLSLKDMDALLDPKTGQAIKDIASKLLQDNGVKVTNPQTNEQAVQAVINSGAPVMRC